MQILTRMDRVVIENYYYMTTIDENVYWMKLTHLLAIFSLNPRGPFLYVCLYFVILNSLFQCIH